MFFTTKNLQIFPTMQNNPSFKYRAFGLNIQSDFEIPEMQSVDHVHTDVSVVMAEVPGKIDNPVREGVRFQLTDNEFLLNVDNVASYYVADGNSIRVEKRNGSTLQEMRLFLLGVVFGALLHQRGMVPFHASALKRSHEAGFLIFGRSGIGKSTLTAHLLKQGYNLLSDDISVVKQKNSQVYGYPSYPFIKLWKDVMDHVNFTAETGTRLRDPLEKYGYRMEENFQGEPAPLNQVFILHVHNKDQYKVEELKGIEKFNALKNQTFRFQFVTEKNRSAHFAVVNQLAQSTSVYNVTRPQAPMDTEKLHQVIRDTLNEKEQV